MPSPFPGMNPYLEHPSVWHDFHQTMMPAMREAIKAKAPPGYVVLIEEQVYVQEIGGDPARMFAKPDVAVVSEKWKTNGGTATLEAPAEVEIINVERTTESYLEIRDRDSWAVVAMIELLSPSNKKPGQDRDRYEGKRNLICASNSHFIEIDLLRAFGRMPMKRTPRCDYGVLVSRSQQRPRSGFWPIMLRDRLPTVPIPLSNDHPDVPLDLQTILHRVYDSAEYGDFIYRHDPEPPLNAEDLAWARELAAVAGERRGG